MPLTPEVPEDEDPRDLAALETWLTEGILAAMTEASATLQDVTAAALKAFLRRASTIPELPPPPRTPPCIPCGNAP